MVMFQILDGDTGFSYNGTNYTFSDTDSINYTYSKENGLTRGASGQNKVGIAYSQNLKTADMAECRITDCSPAIYKLLLSIYEKKDRINFWFIDRKTGEGYTYKNALIKKKPRQTTIAEGADSIGFDLSVESFDITEKLNDE